MKLKHFLNISQLDAHEISALLDSAEKMRQAFILTNKTSSVAKGLLCANLFFEPSTRTSNSFEIAAKRLGALVLSPNLATSSLLKGESDTDTIKTIASMGTKFLVIRHRQHGIMQTFADHLPAGSHIINAGEGALHHPTQALLDLLTIRQHLPDWKNLTLAILGDLLHSRVAHSLITALNIMGIKEIRLISPAQLRPEKTLCDKAHLVTTEVEQGLQGVDAIVCLRLQKERFGTDKIISEKEYLEKYKLSKKTLKYAKKNAIVMHPGPINRGIEIDSDVADGPQSVLFQQVQNGVAIRMAIINAFLT